MSNYGLTLSKFFDAYLFFLIFLVIFNGMLSNFSPLIGSLGVGTVLLDLMLVLGGFIFALMIASNSFSAKKYFIYILLFVIFAFSLLIKMALDNNDLTMRILGWRNYIIYALPFLFFIVLKTNHRKYINVLALLMTLVCLFAITQYFLRDIYPESFIKLKVEDNDFSFYGTNIVRANGLIGNTIIFTGFSIISSTLNMNLFINFKNKIHITGFVISVAAMFLTFSRAAWVVGTLIIALNYLIVIKLEMKRLIGASVIMIILGLASFNWLSSNTNSFIYRRLFSQEASTRGSDQGHSTQIAAAIENLQRHPLLGVGLGTQGGSANLDTIIISDGWLLQAPLEFGIPLALIFIFTLIVISIHGLRAMRSKNSLLNVMAATTVSSTLYFFMTGFLNSALVGKTVYIIYFIVLGLMISISMITLREHHARDHL